jgi:hypothetical protein
VLAGSFDLLLIGSIGIWRKESPDEEKENPAKVQENARK